MVQRSTIIQLRRSRPFRGFTLLEASIVTVIIGVGVAGLLQLLAAGSVSNSNGTQMTTGMNLARGIRELSLGLSFAEPDTTPASFGPESGETIGVFDDLDDLNGAVFTPPIDARRQSLTDYGGWSQSITVQSVDPDLVTSTVPNGSTAALRISVTITHHGQAVCHTSWLAFDAIP